MNKLFLSILMLITISVSLNAKSYTIEEQKEIIAEWEKAGYNFDQTNSWYRYGIVQVKEAELWMKYNFEPSEAERWKRYEFSDPKEANEWRRYNTYPENIDKKCWKSINATLDDALFFKKDRSSSCSSIKSYVDKGTNLEELKRWINAGITFSYYDSNSLSQFFKNGINIDEAEDWSAVGVTSASALLRWNRAGFTPESAKEYSNVLDINSENSPGMITSYNKDCNVKTPQELKQYLDAKIDTRYCSKNTDSIKNLNEIKEWAKLGYLGDTRTISKIEEFRKKGYTFFPEPFANWKRLGVPNVNTVLDYLIMGVRLNDIKEYENLGITKFNMVDYGAVRYVKEHDLSFQDLQIWVNVLGKENMMKDNEYGTHIGFMAWHANNFTPTEASHLLGRKETPHELAQMKRAGTLDSPQKSNNWKSIGITSNNDIIGLKNSGYSEPSDLKNKCNQIVDIFEYIQDNPFEHENKCISSCILLDKIVSRSKAKGFMVIGFPPKFRHVTVEANSKLQYKLKENTKQCGIYKIIGTKEFITDDGSQMGNELEMISNNE